MREALLVLQTEGLVEAAPNRGATVRAYEVADLDDLYQLRALLEGFAARLAAARIAPEDVGRLRESCERFGVAARGGRRHRARARERPLPRHRSSTPPAASGSRQMVRKVIQLPLVYRSYVWYSPEQKLISEHYHRQLTSALARRDAERAELVMKEHVFEARDFLVAQAPRATGIRSGGGRANDRIRRRLRTDATGRGRAGPLAGVRVVELGQLLAGPFTGRLLGDMGAEIIKVEAPGQPDPIRDWGKARYKGRSLWWPVQSRNKKCVTLNLRTERGQELLLELVKRSTSLTENFRPGTLEKWNLGCDRLQRGRTRSSCSPASPATGRRARTPSARASRRSPRRWAASATSTASPTSRRRGCTSRSATRSPGMFAAQGILAALY